MLDLLQLHSPPDDPANPGRRTPQGETDAEEHDRRRVHCPSDGVGHGATTELLAVTQEAQVDVRNVQHAGPADLAGIAVELQLLIRGEATFGFGQRLATILVVNRCLRGTRLGTGGYPGLVLARRAEGALLDVRSRAIPVVAGNAIGASQHAIAAPDAELLIVNNRSGIGLLQGPDRTDHHARRL